MTKLKSKRLLSFLLSLAMVFTMVVTPVFAANDTSSGTETSETVEASYASAATFSEPEAVEAEASAEDDDVEASDEDGAYVEDNYGIAVASEDDAETTTYDASNGVASVTSDGTTNYYGSLADAATAAASSSTISLLQDVALSSISISGTVTLDLNGKTITRADDNTTSYLIGVASDASLTVKDSTGNGSIDGTYTVDGTSYAGYAILTNGSVTLESGTLTTSYGYGVYVSGDSASLTVEGGTVSGTYGIYVYSGNVTVGGGTVSGTSRGISISSYATNSKITVSDGKVEGGTYAIAQLAGEVSITGGEVTSTDNIAITARGTALTVSGGKVEGGVRGIEMTSGTTNITGGTVTGGNYGLIQFGGMSTISGGTVSGFYAGAYVTGSSTTLTVSDNAEVKSTVTSSETYNYASTAAITIWYGAEVTIDGGTVTGGYCGVGMFAGNSANDPCALTVNGGSISAFGFGVSTNGSCSYDYIEINGGSIYGDGTGMYLPAMESSTVIKGGTITGGNTGIEIRAGSLEVSGGTITANGTPGTYSEDGNASGTTTVGAAIAVVQHTTKQAITVTVSGSAVLNGYYCIFEGDLQSNGEEYTQNVSISVSDGTVNGTYAAIYQVEDDEGERSAASIVVTGGTYSTDVSDYLAESTTDGGNTTAYTVVATYSGNVVVSYTYASDAVAVVLDSSLTYVSSYTTLTLAAYAVSNGGTIILVQDVTEMTMTFNRSDVSATFDLNGKTITNSANTTYPGSGILVQAGTLTVEDSVGTGSITAAKQDPVLVTGGTLTINGGTYVNIAQYGASLKVNGESAAVTVNGGTFNSVSYAINATQGALTVNDGYFNGRVATESVAAAGSVVVFVDVSTCEPTVNINGGYFKLKDPAASGNLIVYVKVGDSGKSETDSNGVTITGGYYGITDAYKEYSVTRYLMSGYSLDDNEDTETSETYQKVVTAATFSVGYYEDNVFVVTGGYSDINSAAATTAATELLNEDGIDEAYVVLNEDFTTYNSYKRGIVIASGANVILDLNGHSVTSENSVSAITVNAGGTVEIIDSVGGAVVSSNVAQAGVIRNAGGDLTIEGGTYKNTNTDSTYSFVVYSASAYGDSSTSSATTTVNGGTFETSNGYIFGITLGSVDVKGGYYNGTFTGTTTAPTVTGGYFTENPSDYVEEDCEVATNDNEEYVYYVDDIIYGKNIDLTSGIIQMNVYINDTDGNSTFSATPSPVGEEQTWTLDDCTETNVNADKVLTVKVMAKKMSVDFTVAVDLSNGYMTSYTTSVAAYLNELLEEGSSASEDDQKIAKALLDYGSAVQEDSGYVTDTTALANGGSYSDSLSGYTADVMKNNGVTKKTNYTGWDSTTTPVAFTSLNMTFGYDFDMILTYNADLSNYADNVSVTIGGVTYSDVTVSDTTITISGLTAVQLNSSFVITVSDGTNSYATTMSGLYYARLLANMASDTYATKVTLGQALYAYAKSLT